MGYSTSGTNRLPSANVSERILDRIVVLSDIESLSIAAKSKRAGDADGGKVIGVRGRFDANVGKLEGFLLDSGYIQVIIAEVDLIEQARAEGVGV